MSINPDATVTNRQIAADQGKRGGFAKASIAGIYMDICQHITPPLAGTLCLKLPILGETLSFEIVVFILAFLGTVMVKLTPTYLVASVCDFIVWCRQSWKKIMAATQSP